MTLLGLRLSPHLSPHFSFGRLIVFNGDSTWASLEPSSFPPFFFWPTDCFLWIFFENDVERLFIRGRYFKKGQDTVNRSAGHTTAHCNDHRGVRLLTSSALQPVASVLVSRRTSDGRAFKMQKWRFCVFSFRERPFYGAERACDQDYDVSQRLIGLGSAVKNP